MPDGTKFPNGLNLPNETASTALYLDGNGEIKSSAVTSTELGYVDGVTSSIQSQIDLKADIDDDENVLINGAAAETSSVGAITMKNGTAPSSQTADQCTIYSTDISGDDATLGINCEGGVTAEVDESLFSHVLPVEINGSTYYFMLTDSLT